MKSLGEKYQFVELRAKGISFDKISKEMDISKKTLIEWSKEYKEDIKNCRNLLRDKFLSELIEVEEIRIKTILSSYKATLQGLSQLNLSQLSPKELKEFYILFTQEINHLKDIKLSKTQFGFQPGEFEFEDKWNI